MRSIDYAGLVARLGYNNIRKVIDPSAHDGTTQTARIRVDDRVAVRAAGVDTGGFGHRVLPDDIEVVRRHGGKRSRRNSRGRRSSSPAGMRKSGRRSRPWVRAMPVLASAMHARRRPATQRDAPDARFTDRPMLENPARPDLAGGETRRVKSSAHRTSMPSNSCWFLKARLDSQFAVRLRAPVKFAAHGRLCVRFTWATQVAPPSL
jgi:hypothetical protein